MAKASGGFLAEETQRRQADWRDAPLGCNLQIAIAGLGVLLP